MKDLFEGFGAVPHEEEPKPQSDGVEKKPEPAAPKKAPASAHFDRGEYEAYAKAVATYGDDIRLLDDAKSTQARAESEAAGVRKKQAAINAKYDKAVAEIKAELKEYEGNREMFVTELDNLRKNPEKAEFKFNRPQFKHPDVIDFFKKAQTSGQLTKKESDLLDSPVDTLCGPGKKLESVDATVSCLNKFLSSQECKQIQNCTPTDEFIKKTTNTVMLAVAGLLFLLVMVGGMGLKIVAAIVNVLTWVIVYPLIGFLCYSLAVPFINGIMKSESDHVKFSKVAGAIFAFGLASPFLSGLIVNFIMGLVSSDSLIMRIIVAAVIAVVAVVISAIIVSQKFILNTIRKIPFMKDKMIKKLFRDSENDEAFCLGLYSTVHAEKVFDYFEENHIRDSIAKVEEALKNVESLIDRRKKKIEASNADREKELGALKEELTKRETLIALAKRNAEEAVKQLANCLGDIKTWDSQRDATPEPGWVKDNWFGNYICFTNAEGRDNVSIVEHSPKGGLTVTYTAKDRDYFDSDSLNDALKRVFSAFDHIAPERLIDYAVVDLNSGDTGVLGQYRNIKWKSRQRDSGGGVGTRVVGRVSLVGLDKIRSFRAELEEYRNMKNSYVDSSFDQISAKFPDISRVETRHINAVRQEDPFKYQVVVFIPGRDGDSMGSQFNDIRELYGLLQSLGDGFIPVFLVESGTKIHDSWSKLLSASHEKAVLK